MHIGFSSKAAAACLVAWALPQALVAQQAESEVEEVVVTGSYLRGAPLDAPSPVQVISRDSIEAQGASAIWDVIRNLEVNQGSDTSVFGSSDASQLSGTASVNLRNLGSNSTLTLINGKRFTPAAVVSSSGQEFVDLNSIPIVMTDRVEVLTDGGSALYGSDAVAGVVNVIMRTDFEGVELYTDVQGVAATGGVNEETLSGIWGTSLNDGRTRLVMSGEYFNRDPILERDASYFDPERIVSSGRVGSFGINGATVFGAGFNPAYINPQLTAQNRTERAALGETITGLSGIVWSDPLCSSLSAGYGNFFIDNRFSGFARRNGNCVENTLDEQYISLGQRRSSAAVSLEHSFSDNLEFYSFLQHSQLRTLREGSGYTFSRSLHAVPNPAWLGVLSTFVGNAPVLAPAANNPNLISNGGFGEGYLTSGEAISTGWPRQGEDRTTDTDTSGVQLGLRGSFGWNDRQMNYDLSYSRSESSVEQQYETLIRDRTELAIYGLGGPNCTPNGIPNFPYLSIPSFAPLAGLFDVVFPNYILNTRESFSLALTSTNHGQDGCEFFNPFLTALTNPALANSQELIDWITADDILRADKRNKLEVFDAIISGDLFEMAGGSAQFAAGYQRRERSASGIAPEINLPGIERAIVGHNPDGSPIYTENITNNLECSNCIFNFDDQRSINAVFLELSLPFAANVESQLALRWEDYGGNIGGDVSPKVALSWRPVEALLLRASWSQSFRAPNIGVVNQAFESSSTNVLDPIRNQDVRAGLLPAINEHGISNFSFTVGSPNPNLGNETADTYNVGFQFTPGGRLEGLRLGADAWRFDVEGRVLPQIPRAVLNPEIAAFNVAAQDPGNYVLNDTIPTSNRGPDGFPVACDPAALEAQFGRESAERRNCVVNPTTYIVDGLQRNLNDTDAGLITLVLPAVNAGNIVVQGIDLSASYSWSTGMGQFRIGADFTHIDEYLVNDVPGLELGLQETGIFDAAGTDGEQNIVREVPDNKGTLTLSWSNGGHRFSAFNRHIGSYQVLGHRDYIASPQRTPEQLQYAHGKVDSHATWDVQYSYSREFGNLGTARFSLGIIDLTDQEVPLYRVNEWDPVVFDARGRRWYGRILWQFM